MRIAAWWTLGAALAAGCASTGGGGFGGGGGEGGASACPADLPATCPANVASYKNTIAPLFTQLCNPCHMPGGDSVHYLRTYAEVQPQAGAILDQVYDCRMPPVASYATYPPLTLTQRQELLGWLVCGAPDN